MKRIIITLLVFVMIMILPACRNHNAKKESDSDKATEASSAEPTGEGKDAEYPMITDEIKTMFISLNEDHTSDAELTPVALIDSKATDAGTDRLILCKKKSGSSYYYVLVTVREDKSSEPSILTISSCGLSAPAPYDPENPVSGGWGEPTSPVLIDEVKTAVEKACLGHDDKSYDPIAYLGMQVVAGYNYHVLCSDMSSDKPAYVILEIYSDLNGNAEITNTYPFS